MPNHSAPRAVPVGAGPGADDVEPADDTLDRRPAAGDDAVLARDRSLPADVTPRPSASRRVVVRLRREPVADRSRRAAAGDGSTAAAAGRELGITDSAQPFRRSLGLIDVIGGGVGLIAAFILLVERFRLADDPFYVPSCNLNATVNCTTVMTSSQAGVFGFPNPMLGLIGFTIVIAVGVILLAGAVLPRWFWLGLQTGVTAGVVFVHWLIVETLVDIGTLCPYCVAVWIVTIAIFWYTTMANVAAGRLPLLRGKRSVQRAVIEAHAAGLTIWYAAVAGAAAARFWADGLHL